MLAISNLAWDYVESEKCFKHFKSLGINKIECVLTKVKDWDDLTLNDIIEYKKELEYYDITPYSIQSLFYNIKCENLVDKECVISHFKRLIEYAKILKIKILVLGSPNLRKKCKNWEIDIFEVFHELDNLLDNSGITLVIEPNASIYGGEYFITISEIVTFIKQHDFKNIKTMIDTHNVLLENLDPSIEFYKFNDYISHIHISEVDLNPITNFSLHEKFSNTIKDMCYNGVVTYEIKKNTGVFESIEMFNKIYNNKK